MNIKTKTLSRLIVIFVSSPPEMWWVHRFTQYSTDWFTSSPVHPFTSSPKVTVLHTPQNPVARAPRI